MVTYVVLAKFTDQGIRNAKESPKRADAFKKMAKTFGVTVKDIVWTQGRYDIVTIVEHRYPPRSNVEYLSQRPPPIRPIKDGGYGSGVESHTEPPVR